MVLFHCGRQHTFCYEPKMAITYLRNAEGGWAYKKSYHQFFLKGNRPIKSTIEFLLKLHTMMECYMLSDKMK